MDRIRIPRILVVTFALGLAAPALAQYPRADDMQSLTRGTTDIGEELEKLPNTEVATDMILLDARGFAEVSESDSEFLAGREHEHINPETWQDLDIEAGPPSVRAWRAWRDTDDDDDDD